MALSKTDIENLNRLIGAHGALNGVEMKGQFLGIRKLLGLGFITQHYFRGAAWYQITAQGRKAIS